MFHILTIIPASEKPHPSVTVDVRSSAVIEYRDVPHPDHKFSHLEISVTVDVRSSAVIEYRDVPHPDYKFPHLEMLILVACGLAKSAGTGK